MDSSRSGVLIASGLLLASSFGMGILGASALVDRAEEARAREAASVDAELDQLQEDIDDLRVRLREVEAEVEDLRAIAIEHDILDTWRQDDQDG